MNRLTVRTLGATAGFAMAATAMGTASAAPNPAPAPAKTAPATASATCSSKNPMFVVGDGMLSWKLTATATAPGQVTLAATGRVAARDLVLSRFVSQATVSWNNTTSGDFGSATMRGSGPNPVLDPMPVRVGAGAVTFNVVIKAGAGTQWIGTKTSTPCVVTIAAT